MTSYTNSGAAAAATTTEFYARVAAESLENDRQIEDVCDTLEDMFKDSSLTDLHFSNINLENIIEERSCLLYTSPSPRD